jgi:hypothetical protein
MGNSGNAHHNCLVCTGLIRGGVLAVMTHSRRSLYDRHEVQRPPRYFNPLVEAWFFFQNLAILTFVVAVDIEMYRRFINLLQEHRDRMAEIAIVAVLTAVLAILFFVLIIGFVVGETKYLRSIKHRGSE